MVFKIHSKTSSVIVMTLVVVSLLNQVSATSRTFESLGEAQINVKSYDVNIKIYADVVDTKNFEYLLMSANKPAKPSESYDLSHLDMKFSCNSKKFYSSLPDANFYIIINSFLEKPLFQ